MLLMLHIKNCIRKISRAFNEETSIFVNFARVTGKNLYFR